MCTSLRTARGALVSRISEASIATLCTKPKNTTIVDVETQSKLWQYLNGTPNQIRRYAGPNHLSY